MRDSEVFGFPSQRNFRKLKVYRAPQFSNVRGHHNQYHRLYPVISLKRHNTPRFKASMKIDSTRGHVRQDLKRLDLVQTPSNPLTLPLAVAEAHETCLPKFLGLCCLSILFVLTVLMFSTSNIVKIRRHNKTLLHFVPVQLPHIT